MKRASKSARLVVLDNKDPILAETDAIAGRIRQRAFEISQMRPHDAHERYDWLMAESEVISVPPVKVVEKDGMFEVKFAVAGGVRPDDVNVMVSGDQVLIKAQLHEESEEDEGTVHISDFRSATVFRSVTLPEPVVANTAKVTFEDGIVRVTASKESAAESHPKRLATARKATAKKSRAKLP
jgi:HSP20 family molecular chaperone IbpA